LSVPQFGKGQVARILDEPSTEPISFRQSESDFLVEEIPLFLPEGTGDHLYLQIEKTKASTIQLIRDIGNTYQLRDREIGFAGRKDEQGVTRQWVSVPAQKVIDDGQAIEAEGAYRVLSAAKHPRKLRLGQLKGNRFSVRITSSATLDLIQPRIQQLAENGCPNYFGAQRFGHGGSSWEQACQFIRRGVKARSRREKFYITVFQSAIFNQWLHERIVDGLLFDAIAGDILVLRNSRSNFVCVDPETDTPRVQAGDVVPSGPLWGSKMRLPEHEAMTRESRLLPEFDFPIEKMNTHPAFKLGERRVSRIFPEGCVVKKPDTESNSEPQWILDFQLPKGSYATVFLAEVFGAGFVDAANLAPVMRAATPSVGEQ
jgi:tRNA pseudouridine13 synthase